MASRPTFLVKLGDDGKWQWNAVPPPKFTSDWYQRFPTESTPRFLVDLGSDYRSLNPDVKVWPWKVISVPDLYLDDFHGAQTLLDQGWGAISYQWGEFLPPNQEDTKGRKCRPFWPSRSPLDDKNQPDHNLPAAYTPPNVSPDMASAWAWGIPKLDLIPIVGIKRAVKTMGKRFFWWDGPCLPQKDFSKGFEADLGRYPPYVGPPWLQGNLGDIAAEEVSKQKFVYMKATIGVIWLNQIDWDKPSTLKTIMTKIPAIISNEAVRTLLYRDSDNALKTKEGNLAFVVLSNVLKALNGILPTSVMVPTALPNMPIDPTRIPEAPAIDPNKLPKPSPPAPSGAKNISAPPPESTPTLEITSYGDTIKDTDVMKSCIEKFCGLLEAIRVEEPWFRSLWSYQEGRLLGSHAFLDVNGRVLSLAGRQYTDDGKFIPFPGKRILMDDGSYQDGNSPGIKELSAFVTLLAGEISLAYTVYCGVGTVRAAIDPLVQLWKSNEAFLNNIMRRLVCTGLLFNSNEAPLELLLGARRTRFPSLFYADEYNALTGVLGLFKINDKEDYSMVEDTLGKGYKDDEKNRVWHYETLPKALFQAMVKRYQWHVLMFAKLPIDTVSHWGAIAMGHFETINPYLENLVVENELTIGRSDWKFVLPTLTYMPDRDELQMLPPKAALQGVGISGNMVVKALPVNYIAVQRVSPNTNGWSAGSVVLWTLTKEAQNYEDDKWRAGGWSQEIKGRGIKQSNNVMAKPITFEELGGRDKFLLIPFESLGHKMTTKPIQDNNDNTLNQRCLLIRDTVYDGEQQCCSGTFGGIVDVKGIITTPQYWYEIRIKWQKAAESKDQPAATTSGNTASATTPASTLAPTVPAATTNANVAPMKTSTTTTAPPSGVSATMQAINGSSALNASTSTTPATGSAANAPSNVINSAAPNTSSGNTIPPAFSGKVGTASVGAASAGGVLTALQSGTK